jgi:alpha-mannosidase
MSITPSEPSRHALLTQLLPIATALYLAFGACAWSASTPAGTLLWEIGQPDQNNTDFALAPDGYGRYGTEGFFVVGSSDPKMDWPYVHPGPADAWAGTRRHTFLIAFGLDVLPGPGECRLRLVFLDVHAGLPPTLRVSINGTPFERTLPAGAGDASLFGEPNRGEPVAWEIPFPASLLRPGDNQVAITSTTGSWALYDAVRLETQGEARLTAVQSSIRILEVEAPPVWMKHEGEVRQPLNVRLHSRTERSGLRFFFDGREAGHASVHAGVQTLALMMNPVEREMVGRLEIRSEEDVLAAVEAKVQAPMLREMWLLPHSHVDIGYTHLQEEVIDIQISNLLKGMELAQASAHHPPGQRFKWNPEAIWVLDHFLERATPDQRAAFLEAVRQGEVGMDGLYANMLTGLCRPEELAQSVRFAPLMAAMTGQPVDTAAICDVPGWTWGLTTLLGQAGIRYFLIGPNHSARIGTIHQWDNKPFYWLSPSREERVLCYIVDNYHFLGNLEHQVLHHAQRLARAGYPHDLTPMLWVGTWPGGGVDNAPPDDQLVAQVLAWNEKYAAPKVVIGLTGEFFREFERRCGAKLPEWAGDLTPYWEDGAGSTARETALNRASAERLAQAEFLQAWLDPKARNRQQFERAWKQVLLYSEHTWGAHNSIEEPDHPFVLDQWQVKQGFALEADKQSHQLLLDSVASRRSNPSAAETVSLDLFNTTQWLRTDLVILSAADSAEFHSVHDDRGRPVPCQRLASGELAFLARNVPGFGARRFTLSTTPPRLVGRAEIDGLVMRNGNIEVELDGHSGAIKSLRHKGASHNYVDPTAPVALNDYRYVLGSDTGGARANGPIQLRVLDHGPLVITLRMESDAPGCHQLVREVRLIDGLDRVELLNHVDRMAVREKDSVHFGFGFHVPGGTVRFETPWAVIRPNEDQLPGACRNWFSVQRWLDVSNRQLGITLAPLDAPLWQVGGITANLLGPVAWDEWLTEAIDSSTLYSWAQNNHWFTNYKADQPGITTFRYALRPNRTGYRPADAARFGIELARPLIPVFVDPAQPVPAPLLRLTSPDVLVETIKVSEDGQALILRLFGLTQNPVRTRLLWQAIGPRMVHRTDLTEMPGAAAPGPITIPGQGVVMLRVTSP